MSQVKSKYSGGRVSSFDNVKMSADVASRIPYVMQAESNYKNTLNSFKILLNLDSKVNVNLTDKLKKDLKEIQLEEYLNKIEQNPNLKALNETIEINRSLARLENANKYPSIGAVVSYQYTGTSNKVFVGTEKMDHTLYAGISLSTVLWDSGEILNKYKQKQVDLEISELEYIKTKKNLLLDLETSINDYNALIKIYKANLYTQNLTEQSYRLSFESFKSGKLTQTDLNDTELMLTQVKTNLIQNIYNLNNLLLKIEKIVAEE
jgi:outer membrane protein TolC